MKVIFIRLMEKEFAIFLLNSILNDVTDLISSKRKNLFPEKSERSKRAKIINNLHCVKHTSLLFLFSFVFSFRSFIR